MLASAAFILGIASTVGAAVIQYEAINLADRVTGQDLWEYRYHVSKQTFPLYFGFDIIFPLGDNFQFGDLDIAPIAPSADWDVISIQPDPNLPDDGRYDVLALADNASLADPFVFSFIWRGIGTPGSQAFEIFDDSFNVIERGMTTPFGATPVPEPTTVFLLGAGLGSLLMIRKARSNR
jgi:hypothetical protein